MDRPISTQLGSRESPYPRVYTIRRRQKMRYLRFGAEALLGGLALAALLVAKFDRIGKDEAWFGLAIFSAGLFLTGVAIIVFTLEYRLIFRADEVEIASALFGRRIRRDQIAGRRERTVSGGYGTRFRYLFLEQKGERAKKFEIPNMIQTDAVFDDWVASLPDLDQHEYEQSVKEVLQNPDFGATEAEREERLASARRIALFLDVVGALFVLSAILPRDLIRGCYWWLIAALAGLPVLAVIIVIRSKGLFSIDSEDSENSAQPHLPGLFMMPAVGLALRALRDIEVFDVQRALEITLVAGLAAAILFSAARSKAKYSAAVLLFFLLIWAGGVTVFYNSYFDTSVPSVFRTGVTGKHEVGGKMPEYRIKLEPWGPRTAAKDADVDRDFYDTVSVGSTVCVSLFSGALGVRWFTIQHCQ